MGEDWVEIQGVRFFRSGDIGQIVENGCLQIIDRKKDLWKGPNGEYVALTKVENVLKLHAVVDQAMLYGKTGGTCPVVLVCVNEEPLADFCKAQGLGHVSPDGRLKNEVYTDEKVTKALLTDLRGTMK